MTKACTLWGNILMYKHVFFLLSLLPAVGEFVVCAAVIANERPDLKDLKG